MGRVCQQSRRNLQNLSEKISKRIIYRSGRWLVIWHCLLWHPHRCTVELTVQRVIITNLKAQENFLSSLHHLTGWRCLAVKKVMTWMVVRLSKRQNKEKNYTASFLPGAWLRNGLWMKE